MIVQPTEIGPFILYLIHNIHIQKNIFLPGFQNVKNKIIPEKDRS